MLRISTFRNDDIHATCVGTPLFGGILSGQLYARLGINGMQRPDILWGIFAGLALFSALAVYAYDRVIIKKMNAG